MCDHTSFNVFITCVSQFLGREVIALLVSLSVVVFLWGVFKFVANAGDEKEVENGKRFMLWGVIALFVMLCVWAFVAIIASIFGAKVVIPQL